MKNREKLHQMSDQDLAAAMCDMNDNCAGCPGYDLCVSDAGHGNGLLKWLQEETEEE